MDDSTRSDVSGAGTLSDIREALSCVKFLCAAGEQDRAGLRFAADALARLEQDHELMERFSIVRELGAGGFGRVFLAEDQRLRRPVAIKVPLPRVLAQPRLCELFAAEPLVAASLDHAGIVPVFDGGHAGVVPYLVSGYVDGPPLDVWLAEQTCPVDADTAARLASQLAEAVGHAHERGVLHLDLKPANVLLDTRRDAHGVEQSFPRLTDLG
ncbi:MAG: serine/threonine-protein kinase [Planctomycetia bacterium]|nr:serine/threonine-protein kinase [Planctomycetia bacterium]